MMKGLKSDESLKLLAKAIAQATRAAANELFDSGESFYYFSLITSGEGHAPLVSAWSVEQLALVPVGKRELVKWSYADSPYFDIGAKFFSEVHELFEKRPQILMMSEQDRMQEYESRLLAMEHAISTLDSEGLFGIGEKRSAIVVNVEVIPPDYANTLRAIRLNPKSALVNWFQEAAEPES
jgi:hypothetical protein